MFALQASAATTSNTFQKCTDTEKSWTRRYFVLIKTCEDTCILKYFKSEKEKEKEKSLGEIDVAGISMLMFCPETHSMFGWIHEHFRCPTACVLLLRAGGRDYFLVGENSEDSEDSDFYDGNNGPKAQDSPVNKPVADESKDRQVQI
ncbi:hypothetical protein ACEWY4_025705 [Coilia grayii]|uniref:PH domain-containing protein n=1 Tax=Coilia grayii TaxID=363190 RepID=A0ABD1ISP8_9TELE